MILFHTIPHFCRMSSRTSTSSTCPSGFWQAQMQCSLKAKPMHSTLYTIYIQLTNELWFESEAWNLEPLVGRKQWCFGAANIGAAKKALKLIDPFEGVSHWKLCKSWSICIFTFSLSTEALSWLESPIYPWKSQAMSISAYLIFPQLDTNVAATS